MKRAKPTFGIVLVGGAVALGQLAGGKGLFALVDDPLQDLFLGLVVHRELIAFVDAVHERRLVPDEGDHHMEVRTHHARLGDALLGEGARPLGLDAVPVLRREVGDHQVGVIDGEVVTLVCGVERSVRRVILEFVEPAERLVVFEVLAGGEDVVRGIVQDDLLRVVDAFGTAHILDVLAVHVHEGRLGIFIGRIVFNRTDDTLLRDLEVLFAGSGQKGETCQYGDDDLFHFANHIRRSG